MDYDTKLNSMKTEMPVAMTPRRYSGELPFIIYPVVDLVVNITLPMRVQAEIDRLCQLLLVIHAIKGYPSHGDLRHLMHARFQEDLPQMVDIQFLGIGC